MYIGAPIHRMGDRLQVHLAVLARDQEDFGAVAVKLGGAAFIRFDMRQFVANDTVVGTA
jgi:hypothetical protein